MLPLYEQDQDIVERFLRGQGQTEIARKLGCTRERIRQRLERNGFTGRNYRWMPEREKLIAVLAEANSLLHAAQLLGLTDLQLQSAINRHSAVDALIDAKNRWKAQRRDEHYLSRQRPLIIQIIELAKRLGHTPRQSELRASGIQHTTLIRVFGSLPDAMLASGLVPNKPRHTSPLPLGFGDMTEPSVDIDELQKRADLLRRIYENLPEPEGKEKPELITVTTLVYYRDPKVAAWVLQFADGICEVCGTQGYKTDAGTSYLEVHHVVSLASGGADTIWNAVAVCETCHGKLHRWAYREELHRDLYTNVPRLRSPLAG